MGTHMILTEDQTQTAFRSIGSRWATSVAMGQCSTCKRTPLLALGVLLQSDGRPQVRAYCPDCFDRTGEPHWRTSSLPDPAGLIAKFDLPVIATNLNANHLCERCGDGSRGVQLHHWAPKKVFQQDAWRWPMSYLCISCHEEWHMRTGIADEAFRRMAA